MADPAPVRAAADGRERRFPCKSCGGSMVFPPGAIALTCPYCGAQEAVPLTAEAIRSYSLNGNAASLAPKPTRAAGSGELAAMACSGCGSRIEVPRLTTVRPCPYCGGTLVSDGNGGNTVRPEAILPFVIAADEAERRLRAWATSRWFAPGDLARALTCERFTSLYLPWWSFDSHTISHWSGEAGHHYYETTGSGKDQRRVQRTRWEWREGVHERFFDDLLVSGGNLAEAAPGYQLAALRPYDAAYAAGHSAASYAHGPDECWTVARARIASALEADCRRLIGGDVQRGVSLSTAHRGTAFTLLLLPRWQGGFRYRGKTFQVQVNGQTGEVQGARPWSVAKIAFAVVVGAGLFITLVVLLATRSTH